MGETLTGEEEGKERWIEEARETEISIRLRK